MSNENSAKISGYLEKKGKLRMVSSWKKYWFVLEGRLLLYYRSKAEYEAISPCKGSITLGPPCNIKPALASTCIFQIETRSNTIILRAENRYEQDRWMHAILGALNQTSNNSTKMTHFRYSADDLVPTPTSNKNKKLKPILSRQNTMPDRLKESANKDKSIIERLQTLGAHSYGGSVETIAKMVGKGSPKLPKNKNLKKLLEKNLSNEEIAEASSETETVYAQIERSNKVDESEETVLVENSNYCSVNDNNVDGKESGKIVENVDYLSADAVNSSVEKKKDHIYQEIEGNGPIEVIVENTEYCTIDRNQSSKETIYSMPNNVDHNDNKLPVYVEPIYTETKIYDVPFANQVEAKIYAEVDVEPDLPPRRKPEDDSSSQSSSDVKPKKSNTLKKLAKLVSDSKKDGNKRHSFVIRVLKKIRKQDNRVSENIKESEPAAVPEQDKIEILNELHKILIDKKLEIEEKCAKMSYSNKPENTIDTVVESPPTEFKYPIEYNLANTINIPRPKLKPKVKKLKRNSDDEDKLKTIDEILDDLETEKDNCCKHKVKDLINKFNENCNCEMLDDQVELRDKTNEKIDNVNRHSDDLNELLEELSKVTNAPVLEPGATCSLITTQLTDDEWKSLIPIRKRRLSEPDYDIPRPHSSLQILPSEDKSENAMEPTRFFGPVLIEQEKMLKDDKSFSMTPDSLEIEYDRRPTNNSSIEEDRSLYSYASHNYSKEINTDDDDKKQEGYYSRPKSQITLDLPKNECEHTKMREVNIDYDQYQDSLEPADTSLIEISETDCD